ncbi:protein FAR1-related sequence 3, partial [Tanacetum coccineum]
MDVGLMSVEEEIMGQHGIAFDRFDDINSGSDPAGTPHDKNMETKPHLGLEFAYADAAKTFYNEYAKRVGFTTRVNQSTQSTSDATVGRLDFVCAASGDGCNAMLRIESNSQNNWIVTKFMKDHNHPLTNARKVNHHRQKRQLSGATKNAPASYPTAGVVPNVVMYLSRSASMESNSGAQISDSVHNSVRHAPSKRSLGRDAQNLLDYFRKMQAENPGFYYAIQLDDDNRMANVFWADARSRT